MNVCACAATVKGCRRIIYIILSFKLYFNFTSSFTVVGLLQRLNATRIFVVLLDFNVFMRHCCCNSVMFSEL